MDKPRNTINLWISDNPDLIDHLFLKKNLVIASHKSRLFVNLICNFFTQFRQIMLFYFTEKIRPELFFLIFYKHKYRDKYNVGIVYSPV